MGCLQRLAGGRWASIYWAKGSQREPTSTPKQRHIHNQLANESRSVEEWIAGVKGDRLDDRLESHPEAEVTTGLSQRHNIFLEIKLRGEVLYEQGRDRNDKNGTAWTILVIVRHRPNRWLSSIRLNWPRANCYGFIIARKFQEATKEHFRTGPK